MKKSAIILALALGLPAGALIAQEPGGPPLEGARPAGRQGGPQGPGGQSGFRLLPPRLLEQLDLTPEQEQSIATLEADVRAKFEKILTPEQLQQLKQMRQLPRPGALNVPGGAPMPGGGPGGSPIPGGGAGGPPMPGVVPGGPGLPGGAPGGPPAPVVGPGGAGRPGAGPVGPAGFRGPLPVNPILEALDLNHDGVIDADEIAKASDSLKKLDKNDDGKLTREELRPPRLAGPEGLPGPGAQRERGGPAGQGRPQRPAPEE